MAPNLPQLLRRLADEYEAEEREEARGQENTARDERIADLERRLAEASAGDRADAADEITDEERDLIRRHRAGSRAPDTGGEGDGRGAGADGTPDPDDDGSDEVSRRRVTRAGRRSGSAYDWDVDDDGRVVKLDMARVYSGPDEPERVDVPPREQEATG